MNDDAWTGSRHGREIYISFKCVRVACIQERKVDSENRMFKDACLGNVLCQPFNPSLPLFSPFSSPLSQVLMEMVLKEMCPEMEIEQI